FAHWCHLARPTTPSCRARRQMSRWRSLWSAHGSTACVRISAAALLLLGGTRRGRSPLRWAMRAGAVGCDDASDALVPDSRWRIAARARLLLPERHRATTAVLAPRDLGNPASPQAEKTAATRGVEDRMHLLST